MRITVLGGLVASVAAALVVAACTLDEGAPALPVVSYGADAASSNSEGSGEDASTDGGLGVQLIGRFDTRDPLGPTCAWPGCRILARFEGTSVSVDLEELEESWMDGAPSEWDVAIDHVWKDKLVMTPGMKTYPLASGLAAGPHEVELYKRSEAQNGITRFSKLDFGDGKLLEPPPRSSRRIEIIGDSSAAGLGVEGIGFPDNDCPGIDYAAKWQNFRASFGALLGTQLDAEVQGTVFSGKGLVKNIWRPDEEPLPLLFPRTNPIDPTSTHDFVWKPDVVVVMIGGNDFAVGEPDENDGKGPATAAEFLSAYRTFVGTLRGHYPLAHLFLTVSPSVSDDDPPGRSTRTNISNAVTTLAAEANGKSDARVYAFAPNVALAEELTACGGHGSPVFHTRVAGELAVIVKQKTGW
jgi:lysophospholipase L1-like esterase